MPDRNFVTRYTARAVCAFALAALVACAPPAAEGPVIDQAAAEKLIESFEGRVSGDFATFAGDAAAQADISGLGGIVARQQAGEALPEREMAAISRLLGLYVRLRYRDDMIQTLTELVAIPTAKEGDRPQTENPGILALGRAVGDLAGEFGLEFRNVDNRIFEITLPGQGDGLIGMHTHGDVVPADPAKWVLDDGTQLDPWKLTLIGDRMYGRGTEDDKCGIVVALYAMKAIREAGLPLGRTLRLFVETTEETGMEGMAYYRERNELPTHNMALDGYYPVAVAEKGYGTIMTTFPARPGEGEGAEIVYATGGLATNQIPRTATAELVAEDAAALAAGLKTLAADYATANGGEIEVEVLAQDRVRITVRGRSAHSSTPESGLNPVSRLFGLLDAARGAMAIKSNQFTDAARYVAENWGLDYLGGKLGVGYADDFMGPLTASVTFVEATDEQLRVAVNTRMPRGKEAPALKAEIEALLNAWTAESGVAMTLEYDQLGHIFRNPKGPWITTLLAIFRENTGIEAGPQSSAGATSARDMPNGIQFGLTLPGARYSGHNANEFKKLSLFLLDSRIVPEMMLRLSNLERME